MNNPQNPLTVQAWMYPDCLADDEITDGRIIDVLKPEYYRLQDNGTLQLLKATCNTYSHEHAAFVKKYSTQQFVTISGHASGIDALSKSRTLRAAFLSTMISFLQSSGFTGVEIDFEGFGGWSPQVYTGYKDFIGILGNALHAHKYKLMIDGPAISDARYQSYYPWRWEEFNALPVDYLVVMAYDQMYDQGAGTPVATLEWIKNTCQWVKSKITDHSRIVVGLNSYGYTGKTGSYDVKLNTYNQSEQLPGFSTAKRDESSGEMKWERDGTSYFFSDSETLRRKVAVVEQCGLKAISVWHLGGNQWISQGEQSQEPTTDAVALTSAQIKNFHRIFTPDQIEVIKKIVFE